MIDSLNVEKKIIDLVSSCEKELEKEFKKCDELCFKNSTKVLNAFIKNRISSAYFNGTNGYGFNDIGREKIEQVFSDVLGAEDSLVRSQLVSGTHAISTALFSCLRPDDLMLTITGTPYDTLHEVIGLRNNNSSLIAHGIKYEQIDLKNNDFDYEKIEEVVRNKKIKLVHIQRSKGYADRISISIDQIKKIVSLIKNLDKNIIIFVDNCYCEFVSYETPLDVGADLIAGSLIKNLGGGIAPMGGYIAGKKEYIELASERLTVPGEGKEIGASLNINRYLLQGIYNAPKVVDASLKTAILTSKVLEKLGYEVSPKYNEKRSDIVESIKFNDSEKMINYCKGIQMASPIESYAIPFPDDMPGYDDKIIMAAGTFVQGSTIELSCDGPLREPYIAYQQGALSYEYGKLAVMKAVSELSN